MIWIAILRPVDGDIRATEMWSLQELGSVGKQVDLRLRYNPDMRLLALRMPNGTSREQLLEAFDQHLTPDERHRLYVRHQRPLMEVRHGTTRE